MAFEKLITLLQEIRDKSEWGKIQKISDLSGYLDSEIKEFANSIKSEDRIGIMEEIGDVLMMSIFACLMVEKKYGFTLHDIDLKVCKKLEMRYPYLFRTKNTDTPLKFDMISNNLKGQELIWNNEKNNQVLLNFAFCANNECQVYCIPNDESLKIIMKGNERFVNCTLCNRIFYLSNSIIFPDCKTDRKQILSTIASYIKNENLDKAAAANQLSSNTLKYWLYSQEPPQKFALIKLLHIRFGIAIEHVKRILTPNDDIL